MDLNSLSRIISPAEPGDRHVTFENAQGGWIATGWEKGLPVNRKPISDDQLQAIVERYGDRLRYVER